MLELKKYEGKTEEEAKEKCLNDLNLEEKDLYIHYGETEAKLFKSKKYTVEVLPKTEVIQFLKDYIEEIAKGMNIEIHSEIKEIDGIYHIVLVSDHNPILIGKEGRTLNAIQLLIRNAISVNTSFNLKVMVDVANYKARKQKNLEYEIKKIVRDVLKSKIEVKLDPMNSYDRRVVHNLVSEYEELETESFGEAPNRYVVIRYKEDK